MSCFYIPDPEIGNPLFFQIKDDWYENKPHPDTLPRMHQEWFQPVLDLSRRRMPRLFHMVKTPRSASQWHWAGMGTFSFGDLSRCW